MVLTFEEEKEFQDLKHKQKTEFELLSHKNKMEQLEKELEIAKNGTNNTD